LLGDHVPDRFRQIVFALLLDLFKGFEGLTTPLIEHGDVPMDLFMAHIREIHDTLLSGRVAIDSYHINSLSLSPHSQ
jgi:hypothetical protein